MTNRGTGNTALVTGAASGGGPEGGRQVVRDLPLNTAPNCRLHFDS